MARQKRKRRKISSDAKATNQDEYYTQLIDIEEELRHYREHFSEKIIYCNCDDPLESNFFIYFVKNFRELGLKKLITTCYDGSPVAGTQFVLPFEEAKNNPSHVAHKIEVTDVEDFSCTNRKINFWDVEDALLNGTWKARIEKLKGDGDFRSPECMELLMQADIVCTNPPASLFSEYVELLMENRKEFLILGNRSAIIHKEIFQRIKRNEMWLGVTPMSEKILFFFPPATTNDKLCEPGTAPACGEAVWFTNLEHDKRHQPLILVNKYTSKKYSKYTGSDALNVDETENIPGDYDDVMAVPISFLGEYCPDQFEIVGVTESKDNGGTQSLDGDEKLLIRKK